MSAILPAPPAQARTSRLSRVSRTTGRNSQELSPSRRGSSVSTRSDKSEAVTTYPLPPVIFQEARRFLQRLQELVHVLTELHTLEQMKAAMAGSPLFPQHVQLGHDVAAVRGFLLRAGDCLHDVDPGDLFTHEYPAVADLLANSSIYLASALTDGIERAPSTMVAIDYINKFKSIVSTKDTMHATINAAIMQLFIEFEGELEQIQTQYEQHKANPPLSRCLPPTVGHILWARNLLRRMEPPMMFFKQHNDVVMAAGTTAHTIRLYNKLSKALITYETAYFSKWKASVSGMLTGLKATLLVEHPTSRQLILNADPGVFTLLDEAKFMTREKIAIPGALKGVLSQAEKFKMFSEQLQTVLDRHHAIVHAIPSQVAPLLKQPIVAVSRAFRPGLISLTWDASNIDAYVARVQAALDLLNHATERINRVINSTLEDVLSSIASQEIFLLAIPADISTLDEFLQRQEEAIDAGTSKLRGLVEEVMRCIDAVFLLARESEEATAKLSFLKTDDDAALAPISPEAKVELIRFFITMTEDALEKCLAQALQQFLALLSTEHALPNHDVREPKGCLLLQVERASPSLIQLPSNATLHAHLAAIAEQLVQRMQDVCGGVVASAQNLTAVQGGVRPSRSNRSPESRRVRGPGSAVAHGHHHQQRHHPKHHHHHHHHHSTSSNSGGAGSSGSKANAPAGSSGNNHTGAGDHAVATPVRPRNAKGPAPLELHLSQRPLGEQPAVVAVRAKIEELVRGIILQAEKQRKVLDARAWEWEQTSSRRPTLVISSGSLVQLHQDNEARESFERLQTDLHQLINVEQTIVDIPAFVSVGGPFCLGTRNLKLALLAEATAWKAEHAAALHRAATEELSRNCDVVQELRQQMDSDIDSLDDLRVMIEVLESVDQHSQDLDVSSLERVFEVLREIGLTLPRQEVHALQELKQQCADITATAQRVRQELTTTRRPEFERLLDTQAKALMVATIHLRNSFDNSGPTIEGITPQEALMRLRRLSSLHRQLEEERQTLAAVEALLGFPPTPYPELDRTQRDLHRLEMLYGLYERFVAQQQAFLETKWNEAKLQDTEAQLKAFSSSLASLPEPLKKWQAFREMKRTVSSQLKVCCVCLFVCVCVCLCVFVCVFLLRVCLCLCLSLCTFAFDNSSLTLVLPCTVALNR